MIFLDSSFLISVEVETDQNHDKAIKTRDEIIKGKYGKVFVSDYIFDETVTVTFGKTGSLQKAILAGSGLKASAKILRVDETIFEKAWKLFKEQKTTKFSFTDCTTLVVLFEADIRNIATFDEEFKKVGNVNVVS